MDRGWWGFKEVIDTDIRNDPIPWEHISDYTDFNNKA